MNLLIEYFRVKRYLLSKISTGMNKIIMTLSSIKYGKGFKSCGVVLFRNYAGKGGIVIGNNVSMNSGVTASPFNGFDKTRIVAGKCGHIIIHDGVSMSNVGIFSDNLVEIGEGTNIGGGSRICDTDFHSSSPDDRYNGNKNVPTKPVHIGKRVFIGGHCYILKGVTIGDESVIGGGSVVTKTIPAREIWAGNPAKFIKKL